MDHEFSTSALSTDQIGWDWFGLQFDDGSELMVFNLRKQDGSIDPFSSGTYIDPNGQTLNLNQDDFEIEVLDTWQSPHSKAVYPSRWKVLVPTLQLNLEINPYIPDQELNLTFIYWEGAVKISGFQGEESIQGNGYVELTGYAGAFAGDFQMGSSIDYLQIIKSGLHPSAREAKRILIIGAGMAGLVADSREIVDACSAHGVEALLTRVDHATGTDRLAEAVGRLGLADDAIVSTCRATNR